MSRDVFRFLDLDMSQSLARNIHMITSHAGFLLMGLHIGLHYGMIASWFCRAFHITENKTRTMSLRVVAGAIALYGIYALAKRKFISYITLQIQFAFFDYEESVLLYEIDLIAITCLMFFIGYYWQKRIKNKG